MSCRSSRGSCCDCKMKLFFILYEAKLMLSSPLTGALTSQTQGTHQRSLKASLALETRSEDMLSAGHTSSVLFQSSEVQFSLFLLSD